MSTRQKWVLWLWIVATIAMGLYPPWTGDKDLVETFSWPAFSVLEPADDVRVDVPRLVIGWLAMTVLAAGLCFAWPFPERPLRRAAGLFARVGELLRRGIRALADAFGASERPPNLRRAVRQGILIGGVLTLVIGAVGFVHRARTAHLTPEEFMRSWAWTHQQPEALPSGQPTESFEQFLKSQSASRK
jgi:hypothetical protein